MTKKPYLIDSHEHLQFDVFNEDREEIILRMKEKNIWGVNIGTNFDFSVRAINLAKKWEFLFATIGLHPIHLFDSDFVDKSEGETKAEVFEEEKFIQLIKEEKVVSVGECGLDYFHNNEEWQKEKQRENFKKQIEFAKEFNKPLVLHLRSQKDFDAYQEALEILDFYGFNDKSERSGIVHFFSANNIKIAENFIRKGFYIAFPGIITFNDFYDKLIMDLPIQKLLVETDSPYVAPVPMRGKRNEPIFVEYTAQKIAQIKNISLEKLAEETVKNTKEVFNI